MALIDVQTELDQHGGIRMVKQVRYRPISSQTHLMTGEWGWRELRDYVASQIETRFGPFPRDSVREASIFRRFIKDWGEDAQAIARYAFEVMDGLWEGRPIYVQRFCRAADPYFAVPIARRLAER